LIQIWVKRDKPLCTAQDHVVAGCKSETSTSGHQNTGVRELPHYLFCQWNHEKETEEQSVHQPKHLGLKRMMIFSCRTVQQGKLTHCLWKEPKVQHLAFKFP